MDYNCPTNDAGTNAEQSETRDEFRVSNESRPDVAGGTLVLDWEDGEVPPLKWRKPPAGHIVYFVGGDEGPIKIGFTQQPIKARLKCIQNGSPVKLRVLAVRPSFRQKEKFYHRQFAEHRLHGEWFERCDEILKEIEELNERGL